MGDTFMGEKLIAATPEAMVKLVEELAQARPSDPDEYLRTEMRIEPSVMPAFHMLDLMDTLHALDDRASTGEPIVLDIATLVSILAAHGTVLLMAGHQLGRKQYARQEPYG